MRICRRRASHAIAMRCMQHAQSAREPCAGEGFLAAGDAALALDPLASQGLLNALFTGLAAAEAADPIFVEIGTRLRAIAR
jgi:flavin-dependent dehydrogenase